MNPNIPISHNNTPILIAPTPGQLRPGKRAHESPVKAEHHGMQFPHRPLNQHNQSPNNFNSSSKRKSPPLPQSAQKRRKPSDPATPMFSRNQRMPSTDSATPASNAVLQGSQPRFIPLGNQTAQNVITEEEEFLLHLRYVRDPKPDWKKTTIEFNEKMGTNYSVPALQMRYFRLKERLRVWTEKDVSAAYLSAVACTTSGPLRLTTSDPGAHALQGCVRKDQVGECGYWDAAVRMQREVVCSCLSAEECRVES